MPQDTLLIIQQELDQTEYGILHGILVFNIDDFVLINERYGRKRGDELLHFIQKETNSLFRGSDHILNLKGDEFLVFIRNIKEINDACQLAKNLLDTISEIAPEEKEHLTASVGISLFPYHGKTMDELLDKAYQAMYLAKANGKNQYRLYDAGRTRKKYTDIKYHRRTDTMEEAIATLDQTAVSILYEDTDIISAMNSIMELLCIYLGFTRAYLVVSDGSSYDHRFRFCMPGFETGRESIPEQMIRKDIVCRLYEENSSARLIPREQVVDKEILQYIEDNQVKDYFFYPILENGGYYGAILLENQNPNRIVLDDEIIELLVSRLLIIQSYFRSMDSDRKNREKIVKLQFLDRLDTYVYVINRDSHDIYFINQKLLQECGGSLLGTKCYQTLRGRDTPCKDCPMEELLPEGKKISSSRDYFNDTIRKWTRNIYSWLDGNGTSHKCVVISTDINDIFDPR